MKDTLQYLLEHIVDHKDAIVIDETNDQGRIVYIVQVHQEDMGKVIGKQGRIIRAIRDVIKLIAAKQHTYVDVVLKEESERPEPSVE